MANSRPFPLNEVVQANLSGPQRKLGLVQGIGQFLVTQKLESIKKKEAKLKEEKDELLKGYQQTTAAKQRFAPGGTQELSGSEYVKAVQSRQPVVEKDRQAPAGTVEKQTIGPEGTTRTFESPEYRANQFRTVEVVPTDKDVELFKKYMPGYKWEIGKAQEVQATSYDRFLGAIGKKEIEDRKYEINQMKLFIQGKKESELSPKNVVDYWVKLNNMATDIMISPEEKKTYLADIEKFRPLYERIVQKQSTKEGVVAEDEEESGQMSLDEIFK